VKWGDDETSSDPWRTIVGVVRDVRHFGLDEPARPEVYMTQEEVANSELELVVRAHGDEAALFPALREAMAEIDPQIPLARLRRMDDLLADSTAARRLRTWTFGGFAALALVLAVAGLYGSLAHAVGARKRELSLRMAVGAGRKQIVALVLREGAALTAVGLLAGSAGAIAVARALRQLLFGVEPLDVSSFAGAAALLSAVAFVAAWLPARRAAAVDPVRALREE
jgi:predicted lysophospholipase L1 biosynthesis ABC-type transport system permease subunit